MSTLLIKNVKTFNHYLQNTTRSDQLVPVSVLIKNGKIDTISSVDLVADKIIDGQGFFLCPGLIDPQVHLREPGGEEKETLETGSLSAARGGFTAVVSMPNTNPTTDSVEVLHYIQKRAKEIGGVKIYPTAAVTIGLKGEVISPLEDLAKAGAIALTDDGRGVQDDGVMKEIMQRGAALNLPVLDHAEDDTSSRGGAINLGVTSKKYNVTGQDKRSESEHVKRGCDYSALTGCHYHVLHLSTKESLAYVLEAKKLGSKVTAEVSPHHLLLCDEDIPLREDGGLDANFKMNPPLRSREDQKALQEAFINGELDIIATDHAPHTEREKQKNIEQAPYGIVGLETCFSLMYTNFVKNKLIPFHQLVDAMTLNPAKLFGLEAGELKVGRAADLTLINLDDSYTINSNEFLSKGKNTPFNGHQAYARAVMTMVDGNIIYSSL